MSEHRGNGSCTLYLGGSCDEEFVHYREGRAPCRPIFLLVMGPNDLSDGAEPGPPMKTNVLSTLHVARIDVSQLIPNLVATGARWLQCPPLHRGWVPERSIGHAW